MTAAATSAPATSSSCGVLAFYAGFDQADFAWLAQPSISGWKDLRGKTVGISTFGSLTDSITRYALRRNGLEPERDVQIVQARGRLPERSMPTFWKLSLLNGDVKAIVPTAKFLDSRWIDSFARWAPH